MLNIAIVPHRDFLPAHAEQQKLFVMLKLSPSAQLATASPATAFVFAIDTSSSMNESAAQNQSKRELVIHALERLVHSQKLRSVDQVAIVQFDSEASVILELTPATDISRIETAIAKLRDYSGGTMMAKGLLQAHKLLETRTMTCRRMLLFTDGQTFDEEDCRSLSHQFAAANIPITALGVGDFNEDLLNSLGDVTGGRALHIVTTPSTGAAVYIEDLPNTIVEEFLAAQQEVINNLKLSIKTVQGVQLKRVVRAYPSQAEFPLETLPFSIGNAAATDDTIFILEFEVSGRPASRMRIAQVGLVYDIPGEHQKGELPPQDLIVRFIAGENFATQVDAEVMGYVQQCNIAQMVSEATRMAESDPERAGSLLESARRLTQRIGHQAMDASIKMAQDELRKTRRISSATRKTIKMGSRGKTVKLQHEPNQSLSEEQIRKLSGT